MLKGLMFIMRGLPGSGKSTRAKELAKQYNAIICSTDDFFMDGGVYKFDGSKLAENHLKNLEKAELCIAEGLNVIIDNTNIFHRHMIPYAQAAQDAGFQVEYVVVECDVETCIARCTHNVPSDVIRKMAAAWEN